jgi:hypothetical protein
MYEHRRDHVLPLSVFLRRVAVHAVLSALVVFASLLVGMWGYARFERLGWLDAFLNAAMLLGGMGPVELPRTSAGKLFAGLYALYAGVVFLVGAGIVVAPVVHRLLHRLHVEPAPPEGETKGDPARPRALPTGRR